MIISRFPSYYEPLCCFLLGIPQSVKLTGITISVVMIVSSITEELHPFLNAGLRFVESAIGTGVAVLVALAFYFAEDFIPGKIFKSDK